MRKKRKPEVVFLSLEEDDFQMLYRIYKRDQIKQANKNGIFETQVLTDLKTDCSSPGNREVAC